MLNFASISKLNICSIFLDGLWQGTLKYSVYVLKTSDTLNLKLNQPSGRLFKMITH